MLRTSAASAALIPIIPGKQASSALTIVYIEPLFIIFYPPPECVTYSVLQDLYLNEQPSLQVK